MLNSFFFLLAVIYGLGFGGLFALGWVVSMMFEGRFKLRDVLVLAFGWPWFAVLFVWALISRSWRK